MTFHNLNQQFSTVAAFAAWLQAQPKPTWGVKASTYHNTYRPDERQWRGSASMLGMQRTYESQSPPWDRGPHLYLAAGTGYDGIWVMTPPTMQAIHGVVCNTDHFGIEVVHDGEVSPFTPEQLTLLTSVIAVLHRWAGIGPNVNAHRDCVPRTCPGQKAYAQKAEIQRRVAALMAEPETQLRHAGPHGAIVQTGYEASASVVVYLPPGSEVVIGRFKPDGAWQRNDYRWIASGLGFVPEGHLI